MSVHDRVRAALTEVLDLQRRINEMIEAEHEPAPGPSAPPDAVHAVETIYGGPLPESYRAFLEVANGVRHFTAAFDFLDTRTLIGEEHARRRREYRDLHWKSGSRVPVEGFIVGAGESAQAVLIDRTVAPGSGHERPAVLWEHRELARTPDFVSFLEFRVKVNRTRIGLLAQAIEENRAGGPTEDGTEEQRED